MLTDLPPWEQLLKRILWEQLGNLQGMRILDFGSGTGVTACHYARNNTVVAIEPNCESVAHRKTEYGYQQFVGSTDVLETFDDCCFDVIFCHNVLEYATDRDMIVREFYRILKPGGMLSVVKHNRAGRVMQMVVLLNDFQKAHDLLDGKDGTSSQYGAIHYYEDEDIVKWCEEFSVAEVRGVRAFWDLQQNQELHRDANWQNQMVEMEMRVSDRKEFRDIAFFHHIIFSK